jgi:hypothetical protein
MSTQCSRGFVQTISIALPHLANKEAKWAKRIGFMGKCMVVISLFHLEMNDGNKTRLQPKETLKWMA